ncbi:hypothetical protein DIE08_10685 [Burkholderia sp. Bp9004]|nr:hypothetical protein DIE08_10685 [Burkholderia sp. Bp9004]
MLATHSAARSSTAPDRATRAGRTARCRKRRRPAAGCPTPRARRRRPRRRRRTPSAGVRRRWPMRSTFRPSSRAWCMARTTPSSTARSSKWRVSPTWSARWPSRWTSSRRRT